MSRPWNAAEYLASYADLQAAYGPDPAAAARHWQTYGQSEGRTCDFDGLRYVASYDDLRAAFGADPTAGAMHYVRFGHSEGRSDHAFDAEQYLANYGDLRAAYGNDVSAAARHYIVWGAGEGRSDDAPAQAAPKPPSPPPPPDLTIRGTPGDNFLNGTQGADTIDGGPGNDNIIGAVRDGPTPGVTITGWQRDGADVLYGGPGNDTIDGGPGADTIRGSIGADLMTGGPGADVFQIGFFYPGVSKFGGDSLVGQRDVIQDFHSGQDKIDFTGDRGFIFGVSNLAITDIDDGALVTFDANFPTNPIPQEIEVHGSIGLGDFIL